ncbi:hypothetical protein AB1L88_15650 [Tautonia sp. JC769]|uniref:hypothetical protein n=1 Tax=Tautonia sp. JC769 TaxID=3232135 RepID=UPI0034578F00
MPDPSGFTFDPRLRRYRGPGGRMVSRARVAGALQSAIDQERRAINQASRRLASGSISVAEWQALVADRLRSMHTASAALAAGGWDQADRRDFLIAGRRLREQYRHLNRFAKEIERGEVTLDRRFLARVDMYARTGRSSFDEVNRRRDGEAGYTEERRRLNARDNCVDCPRYAALGWVPIGTLPLPTEKCECRTNCKCSIERRKANTVPPAPPAGAAEPFGASLAPVRSGDPFDPPLPDDEDAEEVERALAKAGELLGRPVRREDLASLGGAPDDATVHVRVDGVSRDRVRIVVKGDGYYADRVLMGESNGQTILYNAYFAVDKNQRNRGLGRAVFGREVEHAIRLGVARIETTAAGEGRKRLAGGTWNGFYTWPRFGYDGPLTSDVKRQLPRALADAERISDLMRTPEGREWWKDWGTQSALEFDLAPGSLSRRTWDAYLAEKQQREQEARRGGLRGRVRRRRGGPDTRSAVAVLEAPRAGRIGEAWARARQRVRPNRGQPAGDVPDFDDEDEAITEAIWRALPAGPEAQELGGEDD